MPWHEYVGYVGSFLMLQTFWMKTMIPLRIAGITANAAMIAYAASAGLYPMLAMQVLMLPVNVWRLAQMRALVVRAAQAAGGSFQPSALLPFMRKERHADGDVLFRAGEPSDRMFLIESGGVRLDELGHRLGPGDVLGEIGVVSPDNRRTATAVCEGQTVVYSLTTDGVRQLFFQHPDFGFFLIRLVTERLLRNLDARAGAPGAV
ncbi:MAG: cyclic nucleotide-binding domain-containing protein [Deltaproteobacteria bacterium]|nr:MAG: cyclic nucleotide-binding domain-containing protein [Deltaproteobacteria bacterium]